MNDLKKKSSKIAIFLPNMRGGGAEKVTLLLANEFIRRGYDVDLVLLQAEGEFLSYLDKRINIVDLKNRKLLFAFFELLKYLKVARPNFLLALMWPLTILAIIAFKILRLSGRVVVSDHTTFSKSPLFKNNFKRWFFKISIRLFYPLADVRLAVSNGVAEDLAEQGWLKPSSIKVILNPVDVNAEKFSEEERIKAWKGFKGKKIVAVGALKGEKDYPTLLHAFALFLKKEDALLNIVGKGSLLTDLETLAKDLDIQEKVNFIGFSSKASAWMESADLLVLSSNQEGLPMVLIEALAVGTPIVSTDCKSGPKEILDNGKYGILVPVGDSVALAQAMIESLEKSHDKAFLKKRASDFSVDKIAVQYIEIFK